MLVCAKRGGKHLRLAAVTSALQFGELFPNGMVGEPTVRNRSPLFFRARWYNGASSCVDQASVSEIDAPQENGVHFHKIVFLFLISFSAIHPAFAQSPNGTMSGLVLDSSHSVIAGAEITIVNDATHAQYFAKTSREGIYVVPNLPPGSYRIQVAKVGFKTVIKPDITLNVLDALAINFTLPIGALSEVVTVTGGAPLVNTTDASVSTVVDRQFAENLPMNGRSFQTLIDLTPGVVLTSTSNGVDSGQFSVNGQRADANYWMVDGVSANVGSSAFFGGNALAGAVGTSSVFGGTNSLVSVDALQEFRIQTSTYAPEFGRTPGGQVSIVTRSGTNRFHGSAFDYLRNDLFDASNWFNGYTNNPPLPKAQERQNDFGGTFSGPVSKDRTFFFFSYEGLRLRLPQTALTTVPDRQARQNASAAMQPFLNAYPFDPAQPDLGNGIAQFNKSYSNPATLDAYSIRADHRIGDKLNLFGRYNYSPSEIDQRGLFGTALSAISPSRITTQTVTLGATWLVSPRISNELRFNYSRTNAETQSLLDRFAGAVPLSSLPLPSPYTSANANLFFEILSLTNGPSLQVGAEVRNVQRQVNVVDSVSLEKGSHSLKFGADFRRLSPLYLPFLYSQSVFLNDVPSAQTGTLLGRRFQSLVGATMLLHNVGAFAQDTWRIAPRLTLTYGLRWELDFAPTAASGPNISAVTGFDLKNLANLALAPAGAAPFGTTYGNVAPRIGVAYQLSPDADWGRVVRGGFGVFYDLVTSELGNLLLQAGYPFSASSRFQLGGTFPLDPATAAPPPIVPPDATNQGALTAFDPHLKLPYALEWNVALEQGLGKQEGISASYVGSVGRRLLQTADVLSPNPNYGEAILVANSATSDYNALQVQFQRRLSSGLQALASYTWSHSIDDASAGSLGNGANRLVPALNPRSNRGASDFDIRHAFSAAATYSIPTPQLPWFPKAVLKNWSLQNILQVRSAPPVNVFNTLFGFDQLFSASTLVRPDVVSGVPFYLFGSSYPGGKALNPVAFTAPPTDANGNPLRQGDLGRNALRGFGATQWDFAVHREFPLRETFKLQLRAELFNLLNHPNFGQPVSDLQQPNFGLSTQMLAQDLGGGNLGSGGFSSLYQIGGPRSVQFALKLIF